MASDKQATDTIRATKYLNSAAVPKYLAPSVDQMASALMERLEARTLRDELASTPK